MPVDLSGKTLLRVVEVLLSFFVVIVHCGEIWCLNQKTANIYLYSCYSASFLPLLSRLSAALWKGGYPAPTEYTIMGISAVTMVVASGYSSMNLDEYDGVDPDDPKAPEIEATTQCYCRMGLALLLLIAISGDLIMTALYWSSPPNEAWKTEEEEEG